MGFGNNSNYRNSKWSALRGSIIEYRYNAEKQKNEWVADYDFIEGKFQSIKKELISGKGKDFEDFEICKLFVQSGENMIIFEFNFNSFLSFSILSLLTRENLKVGANILFKIQKNKDKEGKVTTFTGDDGKLRFYPSVLIKVNDSWCKFSSKNWSLYKEEVNMLYSELISDLNQIKEKVNTQEEIIVDDDVDVDDVPF